MIIDPRFNELAEGLTGYSTALKKGERVLIDAFDVPDAMIVALIRAARSLGAHPTVNIHRARPAALNAIESRSEVALGGATEAPGGGQWQT